MIEDSYLQYFLDRFIYSSNPNKQPWYSKMNDEELVELYETALEAKANEDFIQLLLDEMKDRKGNLLKEDLMVLC